MRRRHAFSTRNTGISASLFLLLHSVAAAAPEAKNWFDVPAQPLAGAIAELSRQAHISIGAPAKQVDQYRGSAVRGSMSVEAALAELLEGTGLAFKVLNSGAAVIFSPPPGSSAPAAAAPAATDSIATAIPQVMDNLLVTATKITERSQTMPASVSVVAGTAIEDLGAVNVGALSSQVSGLMTTNLGPGRKKIFIRGLSDGSFNGPTRSTVGTYLDEAPLTFNDPYPDMKLIDVERVEVLRGPQGTLYGSGAMSGVFRVIPNAPDLNEFSGFAASSLSYTRNGSANAAVEGMVNLPLVQDRLGLRFAGSSETDEGYIDDIRLGQDNVNDAHISSLRGILTWRLNPDWNLDLMGSTQRIKLDDTQYFVGSLGRYNRNNYLAEPYADLFKLANAKITGDLGWATLMSSTTIVRRESRARNDATLAIPKFVDVPITPSPFDTRQDIDTLTQEVRLSSQSGRLEWVAGAFFLDRTETTTYTLTVPGIGDTLSASAASDDVVFLENRRDRAREIAAFANASYDLGYNIRLGIGLRLFQSHNATTAILSGLDNESEQTLGDDNDKTGLIPQAVVSYRPFSNTLLYLSASQGYRNGGVNINTPDDALIYHPADEVDGQPGVYATPTTFDPDKLWNYEFGFKQEWLHHRLRLNGSVFYVDWNGIQTNQYLGNGLPYVLNAGSATNYGFELEASSLVGSRLELGANLFWNAPKTHFRNTYLGSFGRGHPLPGVAELAAGASATYSFNIGHGLEGHISGRYTFTGQSSLTFSDDSPTMGNYHVTDLRIEIGTDRWTLGAFVQNSWSETGNSFSFGNPFSFGLEDQVTPLQPLTVGLTAKVAY